MKKNTLSLSGMLHFAKAPLFIAMGVLAFSLSASRAAKAQDFQRFTYGAAPVLQNPGTGSLACQDTGVPECPLGHSCSIYSYSGDGRGTGFNKTNIEVCVLQDDNTQMVNAAGGNCAQAAGFAQITYNIKKGSQKQIVVGLIGQTCQFLAGSSTASLVQTLTVTAGPMTGNMSISSLVTNGSAGFLSLNGTKQNPL